MTQLSSFDFACFIYKFYLNWQVNNGEKMKLNIIRIVTLKYLTLSVNNRNGKNNVCILIKKLYEMKFVQAGGTKDQYGSIREKESSLNKFIR